jgi:hypothetical protein
MFGTVVNNHHKWTWSNSDKQSFSKLKRLGNMHPDYCNAKCHNLVIMLNVVAISQQAVTIISQKFK